MIAPEKPSGWSGRVKYGGRPGEEFAYHPGQIIVSGLRAAEFASELIKAKAIALDLPQAHDSDFPKPDDADEDNFVTFELPPEIDVLALVEDIRDEGFKAEPNYVMFAHNVSANPLYGNPLYGNPLYGNPLYGNPLYGNPLYGNPLYGNPLYGNPLYGNPSFGSATTATFKLTGARKNTAIPAVNPIYKRFAKAAGATVVVLDSGLAGRWEYKDEKGAAQPPVEQLPPVLEDYKKGPGEAAEVDRPAANMESPLEPVAGHGTFIAGLVQLLSPGTHLRVSKVFHIEGDINQKDLAASLAAIPADTKTLVNLSFGGYTPQDSFYLRRKIRNLIGKGIVVVASAGNDATSRPSVPASLPDVIGVGALGRYGPAPFTNFGPWVRACAPGVDLVADFFQRFDGPVEYGGPDDPDSFKGWARWSGTSFAAPIVCAALAREIGITSCTAAEAVARIIDSPALFRIAGLGTVVNPPWPEC